jgi:energy-coupling factor transporter ATP-binding protein EcfA2
MPLATDNSNVIRLAPSVPAPFVPKRFTAVRFENYKAENEYESHALRVVRRWVDLVAKGDGPMLALVGPQGTGKSHLLYAAAWALHELNVRTCCRSWYRLADELRYGGPAYYGNSPLEAHEHRALLWRGPAILLDEVRPTANTAFDDTELAKLACHCYDQQLPILLTTNVNPLAEVLGPPAASRFTQEMLTGRDRRQEPLRATP